MQNEPVEHEEALALRAYFQGIKPIVELVDATFNEESPEVRETIRHAVISHRFYEGSPPPRSMLRRYVLEHVQEVLKEAKLAATTPGEVPAPELVAFYLRSALRPMHFWAEEHGAEPVPATPAQIEYLQKLGVEPKPGISKLEASRLIDQKKAEASMVKCGVAWCEVRLTEAEVEASKTATNGAVLCHDHAKARVEATCADCGTKVDERVHKFSVERSGTTLCIHHQNERGVIAPRLKR